MRGKRFWSMIVACAFLISCICMPAMAAEEGGYETVSLTTRASGSFHMEVSGNTAVQANTSFPLEAESSPSLRET